MEKRSSRESHKLKVNGSNPLLASNFKTNKMKTEQLYRMKFTADELDLLGIMVEAEKNKSTNFSHAFDYGYSKEVKSIYEKICMIDY